MSRSAPGVNSRSVGYLYTENPLVLFQLKERLLHPPPPWFSGNFVVQPYPESGPLESATSPYGWAYLKQPDMPGAAGAWLLGWRDEQALMKRWLAREEPGPQSYHIGPLF